jgi:ABC-2 type transport system permease protein
MLPFVAMFELPIEIFLEHAQGVDILGTLAIQAAWGLVLLGAGRLMLNAGARKLVVQGG